MSEQDFPCIGPCPLIPEGQRKVWCDKLDCSMTEAWLKLCRTRPDYQDLWRRKIGPGQAGTLESKADFQRRQAEDEYLRNTRRAALVEAVKSRHAPTDSRTLEEALAFIEENYRRNTLPCVAKREATEQFILMALGRKA